MLTFIFASTNYHNKMKSTLLLLLLVCQGAFAQTLLMNSVDKTTGTRTIITNNHKGAEIKWDDSIVPNGLVFFSAGYQKINKPDDTSEVYFVELNIVHKDTRLGCLKDTDGKILITLKNGTRIECFQISPTDCDPVGFTAAFALMPKNGSKDLMRQNFNTLLTTEVAKIKIFTTEKELEYSTNSTTRAVIKAHFALLDKTIKASL